MAVRIDLEFAHPLGHESRMDLLLAMADMAKAERVYFGRSGFNAVVMGEAMSRDRVVARLKEFGLHPDVVETSLSDEEEGQADEASPVDAGRSAERFKAIGRGG